MNRPAIATLAFAAGLAIASPIIAWSAPEEAGQAAPAEASPDPGNMHGMIGGPGGMPGMMGPHHGGMRRMMMHRMMQLSPQQRCTERLARRAGVVAYTVAKLDLTAQQKPLWDKVQSLLQAVQDKQRQLCAALPADAQREQQTILDRVNRREQFLSARLDAIRQVRPALEQFYQSLTAEQKAIIDHPFRR